MSWYQHNGWPVAAINLLAQAKKMKKRIDDSTKAKLADTPTILALKGELAGAQSLVDNISQRLQNAREQCAARHRKKLGHIQRKIESLADQAKELRRQVPELVRAER
jgi:chromosome segregation ATPase